jgi:hypothetical protein
VPSNDDCIYHKCFATSSHYDENIHHKYIATSAATSTKFMMNFFVTNFLTHHLPCGLPHHHIYDKCFRHKDFAMLAATSHIINHVERHNCMNYDVFRHTYDKLECHRFSDDCGVRQKIYDGFLLIVIVVHLTRTLCYDDLFVTMASPKYKQ